MPSNCKALFASRTNRFLCIQFSFLLIAVGSGLLVYYSIKVVLPAARARQFQETKCLVNYSTFDGENVCECLGGSLLSSCYPCFKIHVVYHTEKNPETTGNASTPELQSILYEDVTSVGDKVQLTLNL